MKEVPVTNSAAKTEPATKIAVDARMVHKSGIGTCIQHWLKDVGYSIALGDPKELEEYKDSVPEQIPFISGIYGYKEQLKFPYRKLRKFRPDVLHIPHCNVPLFYRGKMIVTIHDLTHLVHPEFLPMKLAHLYFKFIFWFVCKRANHIIAVSEHTKKDLLKYYSISASKISVVHNGIDDDFTHKSISQIEYLYNKYNIPCNKKIILFVGNLLPHKNLNGLLEGFSKMTRLNNCILLLVGKNFEGRTTETKEKMFGIEDKVFHIGRVSQEDLVNLYNLADLFVLPSLYEGFGLPILEAFACGTPVACSNTSSMPEIGGHLATYFNPLDSQSIAQALDLSIDQKGLKDQEIKEWVQKFSWKKSAQMIRNIAEKIATEG